MDRKLVITKLNGKIITATHENSEIIELHCSPQDFSDKSPQLGDIFVGRVKNIVAKINAAFIEII